MKQGLTVKVAIRIIEHGIRSTAQIAHNDDLSKMKVAIRTNG